MSPRTGKFVRSKFNIKEITPLLNLLRLKFVLHVTYSSNVYMAINFESCILKTVNTFVPIMQTIALQSNCKINACV